ncbi:protein GrpE [Clostridium tepidiprofundi DSM 19306]|uniref:Protein GrpE n=1 Tax=Clostridium tepidiprofundi DSM 19306 TaxID=1121338 RepID=A0A151B401_9CLOT|nr:nucleotide exchange factor GrpE [Clostridium tepidiprofundi]KYH34520.1 protein GrpE [Clostridium tepidiprofundi DSM 19306]
MENRVDEKKEHKEENIINETDDMNNTDNVVENETEDEIVEEVEHDEEVNKENEVQKLKDENRTLKDELKKINNILSTVQEKHLRLTAEYDNYRKRTVKEKENIYTDSCADVLKEFLPVLDNLERAVEAEGNIDELKKGVEMTLKQFYSALEKLNVEEIPTEGGFDPNIHNAVMHIESKEFGNNEIIEVFQKGYRRGEKVLRYSMVKVAN